MPLSHLFFIPAVFLIGALTGFIWARRGATQASLANRSTRPKALAAALAVFVVTLLATHFAPIPGGVRALHASVNDQSLFDQSPTFSPDEIHRRLDAFGATGREAYQHFTYTTDLIFPLALFLVLLTLALLVRERLATTKSAPGILRAVPILWFASDVVENGFIYFLLASYPTPQVAAATLLPYLTVVKFALLLTSIVLPLALYALSLRKATPSVAVA